MPKTRRPTAKGLTRKVLKSVESTSLEPITEPNQLAPETEEQQIGAPVSKIEQEIAKAEALIDLSERAQDIELETSTKAERFGVVTGQRRSVDISEVQKTSIDKHVESMRYKVVWIANKLADELIHETSKKTKKNKEYIKGLVWSFGVMYDKLANVSTDTVQVHIPAKLLEGLKTAISIQIARVQELRSIPEVSGTKQDVIDVTPISSSPQGAHTNDHNVRHST
jgi:hypothetical protein